MYRMIIVTALGNYVVEMVPEKEEPTADELMKMFLETKADVESGCFMEGWTPTDGLSGAPGVFAIGKGLEILAYHVERRPEFDLPPINPDNINTRRPLSLKFSYLGNEMIAKCIQDDIGSVQNYGYYTSYNGTKWLYIQVTLNGVQYTGFSSKTYLKKQ